MNDWKIVAKEGNPEKEGVYDVILIYEETKYVGPEGEHRISDECWIKTGIKTGKRYAVRDSRWFGMARENDGWIMKDQPKEGLVWHEESGSYPSESVYAWLPQRDYPDISLPEGVDWEPNE